MGQVHSRCSTGKQLLATCHDGNTQLSRYLLQANPAASCYVTCIDRNSPLLVAAGQLVALLHMHASQPTAAASALSWGKVVEGQLAISSRLLHYSW